MSSNGHHWDEERWETLFSSANHDAAPPDTAFLAQLREQSTHVFEDQFHEATVLPKRRNKMTVLAIRSVTAAAAAALLLVSWLFLGPDEAGTTLGSVLDKTTQTDSLRITLVHHGKTSEVWMGKPNQFRRNDSDGTYQIDNGIRLWEVDEEANRVTSRSSTYFAANSKRVDILRLLELPEMAESGGVRSQLPVGRVSVDGVNCNRYRWIAPSPNGDLHVEALVVAGEDLLRSLETRIVRDGRQQLQTRLTVAARNAPVDEELFQVADTLTVDGRIGKVLDCQGLVTVKPKMGRRWTPVQPGLIIKPGDWMRADMRGANAVTVRLVKHTLVTLGPGSLVELVAPTELRVSSGEIKVVTDPGSPIAVVGPDKRKTEIKGTGVYRADQSKLVKLKKEPGWIAGFEGATADESIGSLVAKIDGREVPLTVGYHKVSVDIRDQIARTVIEESFVNHTVGTLEGVFYFPLPQDASISGFGMWIGNELVEADVVEKQRAREIYETILRERRDPGLLEWTGGNLFKARVFPIFGHSEKRIKITYTQVLPMEGNQYRYSYALQSEMLRQHPLRELALDVKLSSVAPLAGVTSPTHLTRIQQTPHSARVEFSAEEYTPSRDFEVVVEIDGKQSDVVMIPHRRGRDGYFMLQLTPPADEHSPRPQLLPDGKPLEVLILADTSASLNRSARTVQREFIDALLASLAPEDAFNLAMCDVDLHWAFDEPVPADEENIRNARDVLASRISLGWTDLDRAFESVLERTGKNTHIVYIGDGIVTTGDADPTQFVKRLREAYRGKQGIFHSVAVTSSYEPQVLKAIASLGGGSIRHVTGEQGPQGVARRLLVEIAQPATRITKVEFPGLTTARVYPETLPNLPDGAQQILLGRYLPDNRDQQGEVVVTGMRGDKPVSFVRQVSLKDAERGNSFIPRLWARMHLDTLLEQGSSQGIKDEIIALSEEYHIITPYTSLLVLESDEDRERFKVKRRFRMRDGEKFFAEGRDRVNYELLQQQMRAAGNWRIALRMSVLRQLSGLGRADLGRRGVSHETTRFAALAGLPTSGRLNVNLWDQPNMPAGAFDLSESIVASAAFSPSDSPLGTRVWSVNGGEMREQDVRRFGDLDFNGVAGYESDDGALPALKESFDVLDGEELVGGELPLGQDLAQIQLSSSEKMPSRPASDAIHSIQNSLSKMSMMGGMGGMGGGFGSFLSGGGSASLEAARKPFGGGSGRIAGRMQQPRSNWLGTLFPPLPLPPTVEPSRPRKSSWSAEARELAENLLRTKELESLREGLALTRDDRTFDPRWGSPTSHRELVALTSAKAWLTRTGGFGTRTLVNACSEDERSIFCRAFQLGRARKATPEDLRQPHQQLGLSGHVLSSMADTYRDYEVTLEDKGDDRALLTLRHAINTTFERRYLIDTARHVVLRIEHVADGELSSVQVLSDFLEVADAWFATRVETVDAKQRRTRLVTLRFEVIDEAAFAQRMQQEQVGRENIQFMREPVVGVLRAKKAVQEGKADFDEHLALLVDYAAIQNWERALEQLVAMEKLAPGKPGLRWVRDAVLSDSRGRDELRRRILDRAATIAPESSRVPESEAYFLTTYLVGQAAQVFEVNEMLELLDDLRPVYQRQPTHLQAMKIWFLKRADYLRRAGQADVARAIRKQLALDYPHDAGLQQRYAQELISVKDYAAAQAWIARVLKEESQWSSSEEESLRSVVTTMLRSQGRYDELLKYLADWVSIGPDRLSPYQQYLSALIRTDQLEAVDRLIVKWLKEGRVAGKPTAAVQSRLQAAVRQSLGQGFEFQTDRIDEKWLDPLADLVNFFSQQEHSNPIANEIMGRRQFNRTDQCREIRRRVAAQLPRQVATLPIGKLQEHVNWIWPNDPEVERQTWMKIAQSLRNRWRAETIPLAKHQIGQQLARLLSAKIDAAQYLAFLREQFEDGPGIYRAGYANSLFNTLLGQAWTQAIEDDAFGLLQSLSDAPQPADRLATQVSALYRLTDAMIQSRYRMLMKKVKDQSELSRTELRDKQTANLKLARQGYRDRLDRTRRELDAAIVPWVDVERVFLSVRLGLELDDVAEECWEFLGPSPKEFDPAHDPTVGMQEVLLHRYLVTLANLAARRNADPELPSRLIGYLDQGIERDAEAIGWKLFKYQLLIALDRTENLETVLQKWIEADDALADFWRRALAYLVAEQGKIAQAIEYFETLKANEALDAADYRALADWYMVVDQREKHEQAQVAMFKMTDEWRLSNWLRSKLNPWQRTDQPVPTEFDTDVLRVFSALFAKASRPQNYLYQLRDFYRATREFRLMTGLADAVIGHTPGRVYPFLQGMVSVLSEVREEATADAIVEHLSTVRHGTNSAIDLRALDLLETLVERRAAELLNQPGPHAGKALSAMKRAFKREWSSGEQRLMADFLAGLGRMSQSELANEQLRQLETLHRNAQRGSIDRLHIAHSLAKALWSYRRQDNAIDLLETSLDEHQGANDGVLPGDANSVLTTYVSYLEMAGRHARGENVLFEQLDHPANAAQNLWLTQRIYQLYEHALRHDGDVSLGRGSRLYQAITGKLTSELDHSDSNHRRAVLNRLVTVYRTAHEKKVGNAAADLVAFSRQTLPAVLRRQVNRYQSIVGNIANAVHDLAGAREGLAFLIESISNEPRWLSFGRQDGWSQHAWRLGQWRSEVKNLGDLAGPLLRIVLAELRRELETQQSHNRNMYRRNYGHYWSEKRQDFLRTAETVYAQRKRSGAAVKYIAEYVAVGLDRYDRAIQMLLTALRDDTLNHDGQSVLVDYLHHEQRYAESIPILQTMIEVQPGEMRHRTRLLKSYFQTNRPDQLVALLKQTDAEFHQDDRWNESAISQLAYSCLENQLFSESVGYYSELIPLHKRTQRNRGIGNGTLSSYCASLARAHAGLRQTSQAVDAACEAVVSWGSNSRNRRNALASLEQVLREAPDLDQYVTELDNESRESGLDKPLVRKMIGLAYIEKREFGKAIAQLRLAVELQPNDAETHRKLVECLQQLDDKEGVIQQLLASLQHSPRNIALYKDLGKRYAELGKPNEAERSYTSIVEVLPNESEGHAALAEIRQQQGRWGDAVGHWEQVAKIRSLEPNGLLKLASAQIQMKRFDDARQTIAKLKTRAWPSRFANVDNEIRQREQQIPPMK